MFFWTFLDQKAAGRKNLITKN